MLRSVKLSNERFRVIPVYAYRKLEEKELFLDLWNIETAKKGGPFWLARMEGSVDFIISGLLQKLDDLEKTEKSLNFEKLLENLEKSWSFEKMIWNFKVASILNFW